MTKSEVIKLLTRWAIKSPYLEHHPKHGGTNSWSWATERLTLTSHKPKPVYKKINNNPILEYHCNSYLKAYLKASIWCSEDRQYLTWKYSIQNWETAASKAESWQVIKLKAHPLLKTCGLLWHQKSKIELEKVQRRGIPTAEINRPESFSFEENRRRRQTSSQLWMTLAQCPENWLFPLKRKR